MDKIPIEEYEVDMDEFLSTHTGMIIFMTTIYEVDEDEPEEPYTLRYSFLDKQNLISLGGFDEVAQSLRNDERVKQIKEILDGRMLVMWVEESPQEREEPVLLSDEKRKTLWAETPKSIMSMSNKDLKAWQNAFIELGENIDAIRKCQESYKMENGAYIACESCPANGGTDATPHPWTTPAPGFDEIGFKPSGNVVYQYAVTVNADGESFIVTATGDVNEDGIKTTYKSDSRGLDSEATMSIFIKGKGKIRLTEENEGE